MFRNRSAWVLLVLAIFVLTQFSSCTTGGKRKVAKNPKRYYKDHDLSHLPRFDIPVEVNDRVIAWMEYFQGPGRGHFRRYLERSGRYIPLMQEILKKNNMPKDLVYIALIESGFNTQARSYASAVGPWQFINSTGKRYGMKIDGWVDERRDPYKSTQAAAEYFKDLYGEFGDWYLAMAGYNAGEGRVRNAIAMTRTKNFWDMSDDKRAFRPETRDYVPKYIAAAIMAKMPERFGFGDVEYKEPFSYETGIAETQTDIGVLAKCAGVSEDDILDLNPHLTRGATPPNSHNYEIRLPNGTSKVFREKYAALPRDDRIRVVRHEVRRGDTIAKIARRYGVKAGVLAEANGLPISRRQLRVGATLVIPMGQAAARYIAANAENEDRSDAIKSKHVVRRGETLSAIARKYKVSPSQIIAWNNLKSIKNIRTGTSLLVKKSKSKVRDDDSDDVGVQAGAASSKEYRVQKGDTLNAIAMKYGVTAKQLMALNDLSSPKDLRAGMQISIRKPKALVEKEPSTTIKEAAEKIESEVITAVETNKSMERAKPDEVLQSTEPVISAQPQVKLEAEAIIVPKKAETQSALPKAHEPVELAANTRNVKGVSAKGGETYQVKSGDTLWDIARKHKITIAELQKLNRLSDPSAVKPGAVLKIR